MGYVLSGDELEGCGDYHAEVRSESFYLSAAESTPVHTYDDQGKGQGIVELLLADIPRLRAVLDAVEQHVSPAPADKAPESRQSVAARCQKPVERDGVMGACQLLRGHGGACLICFPESVADGGEGWTIYVCDRCDEISKMPLDGYACPGWDGTGREDHIGHAAEVRPASEATTLRS